MSKETRKFFEKLKGGENPGLAETIKEIGGQMWDSAKTMFDHGRTELAAALFSGHGHVMYMHGQEGIEQGQDQVLPEVQQDMGRDI